MTGSITYLINRINIADFTAVLDLTLDIVLLRLNIMMSNSVFCQIETPKLGGRYSGFSDFSLS
jgi:hypothetical protein